MSVKQTSSDQGVCSEHGSKLEKGWEAASCGARRVAGKRMYSLGLAKERIMWLIQ